MLKIGHRGACGYAPENTLGSFQKAIDLGVDMVEFDVQICKSGEVVVIHDEKVNRTTNGKGWVKKLSLNEIKSLDTGDGERIPTLEQVLNLINRKVKVNIELKAIGTAQTVATAIEELLQDKKWGSDDFLVSSFDWKELKKFHELLPEIKIGILVGSRIKGPLRYSQENILRQARKLDAFSVNLPLREISKSKTQNMQKNGFKVFVYTANKLSDIQKMKRLGVDGIFSNFPDRI